MTKLTRRAAIRTAAIVPLAGIVPANFFSLTNAPQMPPNRNVFGPRDGYTTQMSLLVSMMDWMRDTILSEVRDLSMKELDYLHDENANSVGAMLMHLGATERFYQINTFENRAWGRWDREDDEKWSVPMSLGAPAREQIKGNSAQYYVDEISKVREYSLEEFKKRDDEWLLSADEGWFWGPTNNWCKWFHVCEHESNHNGQIKFLKSRM